MNNPFEAHGIRHLSPSSTKLFTSEPALWVLEKVLKIKAPVGCAAHRGKAAEEGIVAGLIDPSKTDDECAEIAAKKFASLATLSSDPNKEREQAAVPGIVKQGLAELRPYGPPSSGQGKVEHTVDGLAVPIIGFYDLVWDNHGIVLDIKTQLALTSKIKIADARQVALYKAGINDNMDARVCYITPKKCATYPLENSRKHLDALYKIAFAIQRFLAVSSDPQELLGIVAPDFDNFYWSDPVARQNGFEAFGY